jgi:FixJ family two-component response regulator
LSTEITPNTLWAAFFASRFSRRLPTVPRRVIVPSFAETANQEIGKKLFISVRTVDTHRAHIMRKLQLDTRAELVMFALANGVIGPSAG